MPVELAIRVQDLAEKWLKDCGDRQAVIDTVVKKQFVEVLLDDVRIWVKERKSRNSREAGKLAEDYRQARKAELQRVVLNILQKWTKSLLPVWTSWSIGQGLPCKVSGTFNE